MTLVGAGRTLHLTKLLPLAVGLLPCKPQQAPAHAPPLLCSAAGTEEYNSFSLAILSVVTEVSAYGCPFVSWSAEQNDGAGEALFFQGCFPGDQSTLTPLANTVLDICIISENFEKYCSLGFFLFLVAGAGLVHTVYRAKQQQLLLQLLPSLSSRLFIPDEIFAL